MNTRFKSLLAVVSLIFLLIACAGNQKLSTDEEVSAEPLRETTIIMTPPVLDKDIWMPEVGSVWQWQLSGLPVDVSVEADVYDIDLFENDAILVEELHTMGRSVVCYISVGSWEDWREDADAFPDEVIGKDYQGWEGEKWLDVRQIDLLAPILSARLDVCQQKGFDGVEADNVDGYLNDTGFDITYADQLAFNIWLAQEAHIRGLSIGLKNDMEQVERLSPYFDWALTESCFEQDWCTQLEDFIWAGKAVIDVEYTDSTIDFGKICPLAESMQISVILKNRDLDAFRQTCPDN